MSALPAGAYRDALLAHVGAAEALPSLSAKDLAAYVAHIVGAVLGPVVDPYPAMTPEHLAAMQCRWGKRRCWCPFCGWEKANRQRIDEWQRANGQRPQLAKPAPFGSVGDALRRREEDALRGTMRSSLGGHLERAAENAAAGTNVQSTRTAQSSRSEYLSGLAVDVDNAAQAAWRQCAGELPETLPAPALRLALFASYDREACDYDAIAEEHGVEVKVLRGAVRILRRSLQVEMAARGMTPVPSSRRMRQAAEARRLELERRAVG